MFMKKAIVVLFILACSIGVKAQNPKIKLDHIAFIVKDVNASASFYARVFGLDSIPDPFVGRAITWFRLNKETQLHLIQASSDSTLRIPPLNHLCFSMESLESFIETLNKEKISYTDWLGKLNSFTLRDDGVRQIYIRDPDGYLIEVNNAR